jgi:uncharacterized protein YihD (DUF1040 family)
MSTHGQIQAKLKRVRELVELLEHYGDKGWCLPLNLARQPWDQESGFEETDRHQYDVYKYHTIST